MTRRCGENGEWGPVELGSCACPAEPDWPSTPGNAYAVRQCPEGFQGAVRRRCSRMGEWGEAMWDCRSLACPAERVGALAFPETPAGKSVEVGCGSPFVGWMRRECDAQGKWKAVEDACRMQTCSEFRFSLDAANSLFVFYLGNVSSTHLEMTVRSAGNRTFSAQGSHVHSDPLEASIPHEISIAAWNGSVLLDACFIQNVVVADSCVEIEPPFLVSMDAARRPTFGIVFPHCGTLSPASFLFSLVAIPSSECVTPFVWSEEFACEDDEMAHCASREIAHVSVPRSLLPQCVYQASYALSLDKSTRLPIESPLFSFQPASLCPEFTFDISTSLVSIDFVAVSWFASRPLVYRKIVLRLGMAASRPRQLTSLDASHIQVRPVCSSVAACHKLSMITVPIPKRDAWIVVNVQAETEDMCSPHLEASSAFYAFPSIVTRVEIVPEDSYLRLSVLHVSVPAWIDVSVFNVLGEEYKHVTHPLFYRNLTTLTVGGLHPNSRYRVTWRISDHSQFAVQNQTQIVTKPFHPPELKLHVLYAGSTSILVRFWASITAQARCRFAPSEADSKSGAEFESNAAFEAKSQSRTGFESQTGSQTGYESKSSSRTGPNSASDSNPPSNSEYSSSLEDSAPPLHPYDAWSVRIGRLSSAEETLRSLSAPPSSHVLWCLLFDEAGEVPLSSSPSRVSFSLKPSPRQEPAQVLSISPPASLRLLPYGTRVTVQFSRPITLREPDRLLYYRASDGLAVYAPAQPSVVQDSPSSFSFLLQPAHTDVPVDVCLRSANRVLDAQTGRPALFPPFASSPSGSNGSANSSNSASKSSSSSSKSSNSSSNSSNSSSNSLSNSSFPSSKSPASSSSSCLSIYRIIVPGGTPPSSSLLTPLDVFIVEQKSLLSSDLFLEDPLLLGHALDPIAVFNATLTLHSLASSLALPLRLPHPCIATTGQDLLLFPHRCWPDVQIQHSYKLTVEYAAFFHADRPAVFPEPFYFRIVGCTRASTFPRSSPPRRTRRHRARRRHARPAEIAARFGVLAARRERARGVAFRAVSGEPAAVRRAAIRGE